MVAEYTNLILRALAYDWSEISVQKEGSCLGMDTLSVCPCEQFILIAYDGSQNKMSQE